MTAIRPNLNFDNEHAEHVPYTASRQDELTWERVRQPKKPAPDPMRVKTKKPGPPVDVSAYKKFFDSLG